MFESMTTGELMSWWGQYGKPTQAPYYRGVPRRQAWRELQARGLASPDASSWDYTSGWAWAREHRHPAVVDAPPAPDDLLFAPAAIEE